MSYVSDLRKLVGHIPLQLSGTGIVPWRKNDSEVEVLLQLRRDFGKWGLFGGSIDLNESYEDCAIRELREESGFKALEENLKLLKVYAGPQHITIYPNGDIVYHTVVMYSVSAETLTPVEAGPVSSETKAIKWVSLTHLKSLLDEDAERHFFHNNIPIIKDIVERKFF